MPDSKDFLGDADALALAIAQLISDPHRRALAEEADNAAARGKNLRANAQGGVSEKPATNES